MRAVALALLAGMLLLAGCAATTPPTGDDEFVAAVHDAWHGTPPDRYDTLKLGAIGCSALRIYLAPDQVRTMPIDNADDAWNNQQVIEHLHLVCPTVASK
ncbi:hypothetical protein [Microbacterium sp. KR10-403]|uniref:hypothetical protein n=1 Tax=Microbacterium sp. KR10-403 TaxID=3158581 RepID=UPI0032E3D44E